MQDTKPVSSRRGNGVLVFVCRLGLRQLLTVLDDFLVTFPGYYLYNTRRLKSSTAFNIILESPRMSDSPR
ncbi:hypothetical protein ACCJ75_004563 [Escherichia coli]